MLMSTWPRYASKTHPVAGSLCVGAWLLEMMYSIIRRVESGAPWFSNGTDAISNEIHIANYWLVASAVALLLGSVSLFAKRIWPAFTLLSTTVFFGDRLVFGDWNKGPSRVLELGWFVAERFGLYGGFFIDFVLVPVALTIVAALSLFELARLMFGASQFTK